MECISPFKKEKMMKNTSKSRTRRLFNRLLNVRGWADIDRVRAGKDYIVDTCGTWLNPKKAKKVESFDAALMRLNLTDADLLTRQKGLLRLSFIMVGMAFLIFLYLLYNLFYARFLAVLLCTVVVLLALVLAFRYHFWYFQIKHRKLGCSVYEWFHQGILGSTADEAKDE